MVTLQQITLDPKDITPNFSNEITLLKSALAKVGRIRTKDISQIRIKRQSIDARKTHVVRFLYSLEVIFSSHQIEKKFVQHAQKIRKLNLSVSEELKNSDKSNLLSSQSPELSEAFPSPIVVGAGCAGLFCALKLAQSGLCPLVIERGESAYARQQTVDTFFTHAVLNVDSNIQFGAGGAGTFSDGKLTTGTKSSWHTYILNTFITFGASPRIAFEAKPHIGSDVLLTVVDNICAEIKRLGGRILFNHKLTDLILKGTTVKGIVCADTKDPQKPGMRFMSNKVILCTGHSARDVFEMLNNHRVELARKTFAMGVRIEHLQSEINLSQYGREYATCPALGASPYKLVSHTKNGRSAYSFCMCPGGYVVAATSEKGHVVTNGMSLSDRKGANANSGLLVNVAPNELPGESPLAGIELQRKCEQKAFELGGKNYQAPATLVGDFLNSQHSTGKRSVTPTYSCGVTWGDVSLCLPEFITETLRLALPDFAKKLKAFSNPDAVLTAVESRSSSPVRIVRNEAFISVSHLGLYPCGEGAGYAGGIMSAATDGLKVAQHIIDS